MQINLDQYLINNEYNSDCQEIISTNSFTKNFASLSSSGTFVPNFCLINCDIDFVWFCEQDYPKPLTFFNDLISDLEALFVNRCEDGTYFVPTSFKASFYPVDLLCPCEWNFEQGGCGLQLLNFPMPPDDPGCSSPLSIQVSGYCVKDKETQCVEVENQCGEPVIISPGDDFTQSLCASWGNGYCTNLDDGECIEIEQPTNCDCTDKNPLDLGDLIPMWRVLSGQSQVWGIDSDIVTLFGDMNCDGAITPLDLLILQRYHLGLDESPNTCFQIGECVLLNPATVGDRLRAPNTVCAEDFPVTLIQGVFGDSGGSCCNNSLQGLQETAYEQIFRSEDSGVYLNNSEKILGFTLGFEGNVTLSAQNSEDSISEYMEVYNLGDKSIITAIFDNPRMLNNQTKLFDLIKDKDKARPNLMQGEEIFNYLVKGNGEVIKMTN